MNTVEEYEMTLREMGCKDKCVNRGKVLELSQESEDGTENWC